MPQTTKSLLKKIHTSTLLYAMLIVLMLVFAGSLIAVYAVPSESNTALHRLKNALPYPIVIMNYRDGITFRALAQNMTSVKRFYETQDFSKVGLRVDFSTPDGQKRFQVREKEVLNKMIEDQAIKMVAREQGIIVSRDEATQGVARKLEEYGSGEEVKGELERLYGWTLADFEEKVVMPSLYQEKLQARFAQDGDASAAAKEKILAAQASLQAGQSFSDVAKKYSEGDTAQDGGDLGWFGLADLVPELRTLVTTQKIGVPGDVVESGLGFHIVLVEEMKKEDTKQLYRLKQIFTRKTTFADFLSEKMRGLSVLVLSPEYQWDAEAARVEFRKQALRDFEKNLYEQADGDAAFLF
ncbi:MAG: peptidylprolyl isomerase [Candidatus Moraniibacteriota bacterium]